MVKTNQNEIVTADLSKFGFSLDMAAKLLKEYANNEPQDISDGVTLNLNMNSGEVFLSDEDYNCFLLTDHDKIEQWGQLPVLLLCPFYRRRNNTGGATARTVGKKDLKQTWNTNHKTKNAPSI